MSDRRERMLKYFRNHKEYMDQRVEQGIEENRKGLAKLTFVDEYGKKLENVNVEIRQKTHDFKFGANLFMLDELETEEKNRIYKERFAQLFNLGTLGFYWSEYEPKQGELRFDKDSPKRYRRPTPDLCLEYCKANNIEPKLHCLNYDQWSPKWLPSDVEGVKTCLDKRIQQIAERYGQIIPSMEVTNETLFPPCYEENRASTKFFEEPDFVEWSFEHARKYLPTTELIINEGTEICWSFYYKYNRSEYYMQIERALLKGAPIDAIGMQFHDCYPKDMEAEYRLDLYNPVKLYRVMDHYSEFGKPLQVTEITIPAYSNDAEDEEMQAEVITNLYKIWFSHPNMEAIIYWNLVDGYAAFAEVGDMTAGENIYYGALLRHDMSPKPAFFALDELINKTWRTNISDTAKNGEFNMKGFYGEYEVKATVDGKTTVLNIHLKKGADNQFKIVI